MGFSQTSHRIHESVFGTFNARMTRILLIEWYRRRTCSTSRREGTATATLQSVVSGARTDFTTILPGSDAHVHYLAIDTSHVQQEPVALRDLLGTRGGEKERKAGRGRSEKETQ